MAIFFSLYFLALNPWVCVSTLGLCFACLEQNSYSLMSRIVRFMPAETASKAFALMTVFLEVGLIVLPLCVGFSDQNGDFRHQNLVFGMSMALGVVFSLAMYIYNGDSDLNGTYEQ